MLSRRRFLGAGGLGMLALSTGCRPPDLESAAFGDAPVAAQLSKQAALASRKRHMLGYPINMNTPADAFFAWRKELARAGIGQFAFNNVGNPSEVSPILFNTHEFERETIRAFGKLFAFPVNDTWGFLSHSGTDSNMHGMYIGRTLLHGRTGRLPKAYFTREAHYSVQILRDLLGLQAVMVDTRADGGMDPQNLADKLADNGDRPALVVATVGTTFKGAIDRVSEIRKTLRGRESYLHLDAALFGGYLPYTRHASETLFRLDEHDSDGRYDSIAVSCHKFFGLPSPAGLFITRQSVYEEFNELFSRIHNPEYIRQVPGTITCSRDAVKPAEFYYFAMPSTQRALTDDANRILANAKFLLEKMRTDFPELEPRRANPMSNTIYFKSPDIAVVKKFSLATMHLEADNQASDFAHVVVMPHVTRDVIAELLSDIEKSRKGKS